MREQDELLMQSFLFAPETSVFSAWTGHIPYLHYVIRRLQPRTFVELGTHYGASYFAGCQTVKKFQLKTQCWAVDTWAGEAHAGFYDESVFNSVQKENQKYADFSKLLRGTFDQALEQFEDQSIDLLHIDGYHTYEAVRHDFETWLPKLAKGATVLFHDTNEFKQDFGVHRYWAELMQTHKGFEFKHSHGLGVLQLPGSKVDLVPKPSELAEHLAFFEYAGANTEYQVFKKQNDSQTPYEVVKSLKNRVKQLENSTSWKVTAPLRAISALFKRS